MMKKKEWYQDKIGSFYPNISKGRNESFQKVLPCKIPKCSIKLMVYNDLEKGAMVIGTMSWIVK